MSEYKPGTVAEITWQARDGQRTQRAIRGEGGWSLGDMHSWVGDSFVTDVRPLVVLDPDECADPSILAIACAAGAEALRQTNPGRKLLDAEALAWLADQIEQQTKPAKPAEPTGLGAVVEDSRGELWVRGCECDPGDDEADWWPRHRLWTDKPQGWSDIDAVRVLSEGVRP